MIVVGERAGGSKFEPFGPNPKGVIIFSNDGHFSLFQSSADEPKIAANDRAKATSDEATAMAVHGRPFRHPVTVGVYITPEAFVAANGLGDPQSVGMTFLGRVMLSPGLFSKQRHRLPALLTHELSHAHLGGWMSQLGVWRLPQWFKEGLAVMVSGGGAEGVSEKRDAIRRGDQVCVNCVG